MFRAAHDSRGRSTDRAATRDLRARQYVLRGTASRYSGALRTEIWLPCNLTTLSTSPDLTGSIYDNGEQRFGTNERDELLKSLDFGLQPGWGPQWPTWHSGIDLIRYNRVEGLSVGLSATSSLGFGYTAQAIGRIGTADHTPNGELSLSRSNGRQTLNGAVFRRLGVANDDWGEPLVIQRVAIELLYGRDEGFYYRTWGAELGGTRDAPVRGQERRCRGAVRRTSKQRRRDAEYAGITSPRIQRQHVRREHRRNEAHSVRRRHGRVAHVR